MPKKRKQPNRPFESRRSFDGQFVKLTHDQMESEAWAELSPADIFLYLLIRKKYTFNRKTGNSNEDNLSLTHREVADKVGRNTFWRSIDNLIGYGFIDIREQRPYGKQCNIYALSSRWQKYHKDADLRQAAGFEEKQRIKISSKNKNGKNQFSTIL